MALIALENIELTLAERQILKNINLQVHEKEIITLIGPNGAGKTSLVKVVLGLIKPTRGKVVRQQKLSIGYMPQQVVVEPTLPLTVERFLKLVRRASNKDIQNALARVGVTHLQRSPVQNISGGEMQRVLLARALLNKPQLLVLDEPVQGVDVGGQGEMYQMISSLRDELGCAVFMISHDLHLVMASTDTVICLNQHVCCSGHPEHVTQDPAYLEIFGQYQPQHVAVYTHHHDHHHDLHGDIVQGGASKEDSAQEPQNQHNHEGCNHG